MFEMPDNGGRTDNPQSWDRDGYRMIRGEDLVQIALDSDAERAAVLDTSQIEFHEDFRKACERNVCGKYGTNWMGPPAIGPISELKRRVEAYRHGLLFQTVHRVAGSFDIKGMVEKAAVHEKIFRDLLGRIRERYPSEYLLPLGAGCCGLCERCAYLDDEPCRHPDQAASSVEAYGINVIALEKSAGLPCYNGKGTVTYVGLILFNKT
jgi:predicted metal-binding protein